MICDLNRFAEWLEEKNLKERTIENYIYYFNKFTYGKFNQETVSKFMASKANRNMVARSFLVNLKKFLLVNYKELGLDSIYIEDVATVELPKLTGRTKQRIIKPIPHEQIALLEKHLPTEQLKLQLLLSYYCGLRLGELLKITIMSFNWEEWKKDPNKMGECRVYGKGDKEGIALVPSELMVRTARYIRNTNFESINSRLFVFGRGNIKNKSRTWQMKLRKAGIESGITKIDNNGKIIPETVVFPHRLRHSYATYLLNERKLNLREVQEILRHSSITSTQVYTYVDKEHLKERLNNKG